MDIRPKIIEIVLDASEVIAQWERRAVEVDNYVEAQDAYLEDFFGLPYRVLISDGERCTLTFVFANASEAVMFQLKHTDIEVIKAVPV